MPDKCCADTSSLIHAWVRSYPFRNFGSVWDRFDEIIEAGRLYSSSEVLRELSRKMTNFILGQSSGRKCS